MSDEIKYFPNDREEYTNLIIVDMSCPHTVTLLQDVDRYLYLYYKWILLNSKSEAENFETNRRFFLRLLEPLPVLISSEVYLILQQSERVYKIQKSMLLLFI